MFLVRWKHDQEKDFAPCSLYQKRYNRHNLTRTNGITAASMFSTALRDKVSLVYTVGWAKSHPRES